MIIEINPEDITTNKEGIIDCPNEECMKSTGIKLKTVEKYKHCGTEFHCVNCKRRIKVNYVDMIDFSKSSMSDLDDLNFD